MHVQLRFDTTEAEWYGELRACPTMPACGVFPGHKHQHNVPLSTAIVTVIVAVAIAANTLMLRLGRVARRGASHR